MAAESWINGSPPRAYSRRRVAPSPSSSAVVLEGAGDVMPLAVVDEAAGLDPATGDFEARVSGLDEEGPFIAGGVRSPTKDGNIGGGAGVDPGGAGAGRSAGDTGKSRDGD